MGAYATGAPRLPLGVAVLAVLSGIFGAIVLVGGLVIVLAALFLSGSVGWTAMWGSGLVAGLVALIIGVFILAVATGLWDQELWAFALAVIASGFGVLWFIARPLVGGGGLVSIETVPALLFGALFVYLLAVNDAFW